MMSLRPVVAWSVLLLAVSHSLAADSPSPALSSAMRDAQGFMTTNQPLQAVDALERQLPAANGDAAYLDQLRAAYAAAIKLLQATDADPKRLGELRTKLALLGGTAPPEAPAPSKEGGDALLRATTLFNQARSQPSLFGDAAKMFASAFLGKVRLSDDQMTAWAYCRVRVAAEQLNKAGGDPATAAEVVREVEDALRLAPNNAGLQKAGSELLAAARQRAGNTPPRSPAAKLMDGWEVVETASFRVRHQGARAAAEAVAHAAEGRRTDIFSRWSGPPGGAWTPKCEIVLHADVTAFTAATRQPPASTGQAVVRLNDGLPTERRIDLRLDDAAAATDALPRELTHVVLADLFPAQAPPKWAVTGMAVLASSPCELDRYQRTLPRCYRDGELMPVASLLGLAAPPADRVTGFLVQSVSLVEFLVKWKGEKAFTTFLRDTQRYGQEAALKRQYGVTDAGQLQEVWRQNALTAARGQGE